jgi:hypothetical protein
MNHRPCARRAFVPLVVLGSLLWAALILARGEEIDALPQSMGCADPGAGPLSILVPRLGPCQVGLPFNPSFPRRHHHDTHHEDQSPV